MKAPLFLALVMLWIFGCNKSAQEPSVVRETVSFMRQDYACFPDTQDFANLSEKSNKDLVGSIEEGVPLRLHVTQSQICDPEVREALRARKGPIELDVSRVHFVESALLPCLHSLGSRLCGLAGPFTGLTGEGIQGLLGVRFLGLGPELTDAGFARLNALPTLRQLYLSFTPISDAGLAHLVRFPKLQTLWLSGTSVTDDGLAHVQRLSRLRGLWLNETSVGDAGLAQIKELRNLRELYLGNTRISDKGLGYLADLHALQKLWLNETKTTDEGLKHLKKLRELREVWLWDTSVTDAGLAHLKDHRELRELWLSGPEITDAGLVHLRGLQHLEKLWLKDTKVTDAGAEKFETHLPKCSVRK